MSAASSRSRGGTIVFHKGYGAKVQPDSTYRRCVDYEAGHSHGDDDAGRAGKASLGDPVSTYLPEFTGATRKVRVLDLLAQATPACPTCFRKIRSCAARMRP